MRGLRSSLTVISLVAASELCAESPGIPALNRYFGLGWGDGYHASSAGCPGQSCCQPAACAPMAYGVPMQPTAGGIWTPAPAGQMPTGPAVNSWGAPAYSAPTPASPQSQQQLPDPRVGYYAPRHVYPSYRPAPVPVAMPVTAPAAPVLYYPAPIMPPVQAVVVQPVPSPGVSLNPMYVQQVPSPTPPLPPRVAQTPGFRVSIP